MKPDLMLLLPSACLISACAVEPKPEIPPEVRVIVQKTPLSEVDQLLECTVQARKLGSREFASGRDQLRKVFQAERSESSRFKLAVLLALTPPSSPASASDAAELVLLLKPLAPSMNNLERKLATLKSIDSSVNRRSSVQSSESQRVEST